jgi:hypothetical protein
VIYDKVDAWEACTWATWFDPEVERFVEAVVLGQGGKRFF